MRQIHISCNTGGISIRQFSTIHNAIDTYRILILRAFSNGQTDSAPPESN